MVKTRVSCENHAFEGHVAFKWGDSKTIHVFNSGMSNLEWNATRVLRFALLHWSLVGLQKRCVVVAEQIVSSRRWFPPYSYPMGLSHSWLKDIPKWTWFKNLCIGKSHIFKRSRFQRTMWSFTRLGICWACVFNRVCDECLLKRRL